MSLDTFCSLNNILCLYLQRISDVKKILSNGLKHKPLWNLEGAVSRTIAKIKPYCVNRIDTVCSTWRFVCKFSQFVTGSDDPRMQRHHSDSSAIPEASLHLHRSLDRGPLIIPNIIQQQQLAPQKLQHRRSSAETLVAKVGFFFFSYNLTAFNLSGFCKAIQEWKIERMAL